MNLQESKTGFYYVGTKRANITKLVNIYKHGYASGKFHLAMTELSRKEILPEVICCDSSYGFEAIQQLAGFIYRDEKLSGIPLIVDADRNTAAVIFQFSHNRTIDDILNLNEWDENRLISKIEFLQELKIRNREMKKEQKKETTTLKAGNMPVFLKKSLNFLFSRQDAKDKRQIHNE